MIDFIKDVLTTFYHLLFPFNIFILCFFLFIASAIGYLESKDSDKK